VRSQAPGVTAIAGLLLLAACAQTGGSTDPRSNLPNWPVVGGFEHFNEQIEGTVWLNEAKSEFHFEVKGTTTHLKCVGPGEIESSIVKPDQCREIEGGFSLHCGVHRELFGSFEYSSCGYGFAAGIDTFSGSTVAMHFALTPENYAARRQHLETYAASQPALIDPFDTPENPDIDPDVYGFGTGFAVTEGGYILTAAHVVDDQYGIKVRSGDRTADAEIVAMDTENDLALLKAELTFDPLVLMDWAPSRLQMFDAEAIGYRFAFDGTRKLRAEPATVPPGGGPGYYFFEADIIPGYSGGPLLTVPEYKVTGVLNAISVRYRLKGWNDYHIRKMTYATDYDAMMEFLAKSLEPETMDAIVARSKVAPDQPPIDHSDAIVLVLVY
jgi:S1-C subfamily serine protease